MIGYSESSRPLCVRRLWESLSTKVLVFIISSLVEYQEDKTTLV
jgi:hypothetical protein